MEKSIFRALAQSALNEREQKSLSGGNIMRKITILIVLCTIFNCAYAQLPPSPQTLDRSECIDSTLVELMYTFKFKLNRNSKNSEDIRKVFR